MLSRDEFNILYHFIKKPKATQREIAKTLGRSNGEINTLVSLLKKQAYLSADGEVTATGYAVLEPYKVKMRLFLLQDLHRVVHRFRMNARKVFL